jgi:hypothetical protein
LLLAFSVGIQAADDAFARHWHMKGGPAKLEVLRRLSAEFGVGTVGVGDDRVVPQKQKVWDEKDAGELADRVHRLLSEGVGIPPHELATSEKFQKAMNNGRVPSLQALAGRAMVQVDCGAREAGSSQPFEVQKRVRGSVEELLRKLYTLVRSENTQRAGKEKVGNVEAWCYPDGACKVYLTGVWWKDTPISPDYFFYYQTSYGLWYRDTRSFAKRLAVQNSTTKKVSMVDDAFYCSPLYVDEREHLRGSIYRSTPRILQPDDFKRALRRLRNQFGRPKRYENEVPSLADDDTQAVDKEMEKIAEDIIWYFAPRKIQNVWTKLNSPQCPRTKKILVGMHNALDDFFTQFLALGQARKIRPGYKLQELECGDNKAFAVVELRRETPWEVTPVIMRGIRGGSSCIYDCFTSFDRLIQWMNGTLDSYDTSVDARAEVPK